MTRLFPLLVWLALTVSAFAQTYTQPMMGFTSSPTRQLSMKVAGGADAWFPILPLSPSNVPLIWTFAGQGTGVNATASGFSAANQAQWLVGTLTGSGTGPYSLKSVNDTADSAGSPFAISTDYLACNLNSGAHVGSRNCSQIIFTKNASMSGSFTATFAVGSPGTITAAAHGLPNKTNISFPSTLYGVTGGTVYYTQNVTANTFQLSTDVAGTSMVNFSGAGTQTATWGADPTNKFYSAFFPQFYSSVGDGGTSTTPKGSYYGFNAITQVTGGEYLNGTFGGEMDLSVSGMTNPPKTQNILSLAYVNGHAKNGTSSDSMLAFFRDNSTTNGATDLIDFGRWDATWPCKPGGCNALIAAVTPGTGPMLSNNGVDFRGVAFSECAFIADNFCSQKTAATVQTNAGLLALNTTDVPSTGSVFRQGFSSAGDGGAMFYTPSNSACSLNAGNGDNGSQVKSANSKCWLWVPGTTKVTPKVFGAAGDGTTDDAAAVQAAMVAIGNQGTLYTGPYVYALNSTVELDSNVKDENGGQDVEVSLSCRSGFRAKSDINLFSVGFDNVVVSTCADVGAVTSTHAFLTYSGTKRVTVKDSQINRFCIGVSISGTSSTNNLFSGIFNSTIVPFPSVGCAGIVIGQGSQVGHTGDFRADNNFIYCESPAATGMIIYDGGGIYLDGNENYGCKNGTIISPGLNQAVEYIFAVNTILGDTTSGPGLLIDTTDASAQIFNLHFGSGSWASSSSGDHVVSIKNTGASTQVKGIEFVGVRIYISNTTKDGFSLAAGQDVSIKSSEICSYVSAAGNGVSIASGVSAQIVANNIGGCDQVSGTLATGITASSGSANLVITDNSLIRTTTPLSITDGSNQNFVIAKNLGVDTSSPTVASAGTITAPANPVFFVSGVAAINTINGRWNNREITIIPTGASSFAGGGNISSPIGALTAFSPVRLTYSSSLGSWVGK